jgi:gentisate 1,2-dioxygenase
MTNVRDTTELDAFYASLPDLGVVPLWLRSRELASFVPDSHVVPTVWHYEQIRPALQRAGELVSAEEAERRVLMLLNPAPRIAALGGTTPTLYAGIQLVGPHEAAPRHRHTASAFRLVIEAPAAGVCTTVDDVPIDMHPGDVVLTPNGRWHEHINDADEPIIWLDGLDMPLVIGIEAMFFEPSSADDGTPGPSLTTLTSAPVGVHPGIRPDASSPHLYRWADAEAAVQAALATGADEAIIEYVREDGAAPVLPTLNCFVHAVAPGERSVRRQETPTAIYHVLRGHGVTVVNGEELAWQERDTFCVPAWAAVEHVNGSDAEPAVLFRYDNRSLYEHLGLYRERIES